jgi:hypothetical protein
LKCFCDELVAWAKLDAHGSLARREAQSPGRS